MENERLNALKEILATQNIEEMIVLKKKYRDVLLTPDDVEVINRHAHYLQTKSCIERNKGDISAYAQCALNQLKVKLGKEGKLKEE